MCDYCYDGLWWWALFIRLESIMFQNLVIMLLAFPQFSAYYTCFYAFQKCIMLLFCFFFVQRSSYYDTM